MSWNSYKWILLGFHNGPITTEQIQPLEDIRLAYFYTIWFTRNEAMWQFKYLPGKVIFRNKLINYIAHRHIQAIQQQTIQTFNNSYGIIYKAGKLTQPMTQTHPATLNPSPTQPRILYM